MIATRNSSISAHGRGSITRTLHPHIVADPRRTAQRVAGRYITSRIEIRHVSDMRFGKKKVASVSAVEPSAANLAAARKWIGLASEIPHSHRTQTLNNSFRCFVSSNE
ncbi:hypothetical protein EVAR_4126_1 [Eumeta japonica]|uniref:Uncharacterized protein n=1 Tax=Eumeta variegata TaxID=151549 RepID=A0A4C2A1X5_EUMVA|nr:hypothetical protein EVAR_4126_1 [Eumeta japonica]